MKIQIRILQIRIQIKIYKIQMKYLTNKIGDKNFILIESSDTQKSIGKDQHFIKVQIDQKIQEGNIIPCVYTGIYNDVLLAKRI